MCFLVFSHVWSFWLRFGRGRTLAAWKSLLSSVGWKSTAVSCKADAGLKTLWILRGAVACCRQTDNGHVLDNQADSVLQTLQFQSVRRLYGAPLLKGTKICLQVDVLDPAVVLFGSGGPAEGSGLLSLPRATDLLGLAEVPSYGATSTSTLGTKVHDEELPPLKNSALCVSRALSKL